MAAIDEISSEYPHYMPNKDEISQADMFSFYGKKVSIPRYSTFILVSIEFCLLADVAEKRVDLT